MNIDRRPPSSDLIRRLQIIAPDILALVVLAYLLWGAFQALTYPFDGFVGVQASGLITEISDASPAYGRLQEGDIIVSIAGMSWAQGIPDYQKIGKGNLVQFEALREGELIRATITLMDPPISEMFARLSPLLIAAIFWGVGLVVHLFNASAPAIRQFFLLSMTSAVFLISGLMSSFGEPRSTILFGFLIWMVGPLGVHLHFYFPQTVLARSRRRIMGVLYALGFLGGFPIILWGSQKLDQSFPGWSSVGRLYLVANILFVIVLLFYAYLHATTPGTRGKVRLIALGCGLSLLPAVALAILPDTLLGQPILDYHFAFLLVGVLPLSYGYVFFRHRMVNIDRRINRGVSYIIVYSILGISVALLLMVAHRYGSLSRSQIPWLGALLIIVSVAVYSPLRQTVQKVIDKIFYGGWYDYRSATVQLTRSLESITDLQALANTLSVRLVETLRLQAAGVLLRDSLGNFSILAIEPISMRSAWPRAGIPVLPEESLAFFSEIGIADKADLLRALPTLDLSPNEHCLLEAEDISLWVPVHSRGSVQGLLFLGHKFGGDIFSREDMDILNLLAGQLAPVVSNIHLLNQLRSHAAELEVKVKERTSELHDAKERVEAILASVGDGVIVTDLDGRILTVNAAIEQKSGYQASELIGQELNVLYNGQNSSQAFLAMQTSLDSSQTWNGELVAHRKDGDTFVVQITTAPVRDQDGQIIGYVGSQRDITQQKQLEQLKDQLVLGFSHNLRTPIANIYLYLDLLENKNSEIQERALKVLKEQSQLLKSMLDDVLALQMLTINGQEEPEFIQVDLNQLAQMTIEKHLPVVATSDLKISFEPGAGLPLVEGDPRQLVSVIANLLSNAFRYTQAGEVRVRTFLDGDRVVMEVLDTGVGITAGDLPHIFDPFYRGRNVRESDLIGSGLGLAIAREIARVHSGSISVESEPGKGSKFRLYLPV